MPADEASLYPIKHLFTRLSNNEEAEANLSTFATEIRTMTYILESATQDSIVLIDELGVCWSPKPFTHNSADLRMPATVSFSKRNTGSHEGIGIAHAVSEELIGRRVPTIFATHFSQLATTLSPYTNVNLQHFSAVVDAQSGEPNLSFKHRLVSGGCEQ